MTQQQEIYSQLDRIASKVAAMYFKNNSWLGFDDLYQQAWLSMLEGLSDYDESKGASVKEFLWTPVWRGLYRYVYIQRSPVKLSTSGNIRKTGMSLMRIDDYEMQSPCLIFEHVYQHEVASIVKSTAEGIASTIDGGDLALSVLLYEEKPRDLAERMGVPITRVYQVTNEVKRRLKSAANKRLLRRFL